MYFMLKQLESLNETMCHSDFAIHGLPSSALCTVTCAILFVLTVM